MTPRVELLIIGNEILSGQTQDTNSQWLAQRLLELDLLVNRIQVVEDHISSIASAIKNSRARSTTLLITSGGLGPTFDDLTAKGLATAAETKLELHQTALKMVTNRYLALNAQSLVEHAKITPSRKKMAMLPVGADPLPNDVGTAPGIKLQLDTTTVFCLPGVPQELYSMFLEAVAPQIASLAEKVVVQELIQVPILDESQLAPLIDTIMQEAPGVYLKSLPRPYQTRQPLRVTITASGSTKDEAKKRLSKTIESLQAITKAHRQI